MSVEATVKPAEPSKTSARTGMIPPEEMAKFNAFKKGCELQLIDGSCVCSDTQECEHTPRQRCPFEFKWNF
jgi:hypothetical protein